MTGRKISLEQLQARTVVVAGTLLDVPLIMIVKIVIIKIINQQEHHVLKA